MKSKIAIIILTVLFLISIGSAAAADINNDTLEIDEAETVLQETSHSLTDLTEDITQTTSGGELKLNHSYEYDSSKDSSLQNIKIRKPITIDGQGNTIDAKNTKSIFSILSSNIVLKNIVFKNAYSTGSGASVTTAGSYSSNISIINCTFENSYSKSNGGAVLIYMAKNVTIANSTFKSNTASGIGGAIYVLSSNDVVITNSSFDLNKANDGGALKAEYATRFKLDNLQFTNNVALEGNGGALNIIYSDYVPITNSRFENNTVYGKNGKGNGGAIYAQTTLNITNLTIKSNRASIGGAGIYADSYNSQQFVNIRNCTFDDNQCNNTGGGLYISVSDDSNVTDCVFTNNYAFNGGGAYVVGNVRKGTNVINSTFENNAAKFDGGALYWGNYDGDVVNSRFDGNSAGEQGGTIYWTQRQGLIENCTVKNSKSAEGGAIYWTGFYPVQASNSVIRNCTFENASATTGGIIHIYRVNAINITGSSFDDGVATYGGAIYVHTASDILINNSKVYGSSASYGGAIYARSSNVLINGSEFENNFANTNGGAIYLYVGTGEVKSSLFANNSAVTSGGAIYAHTASNFLINDSKVFDSSATSGGAIYASSSNVLINGSEFENNFAKNYGGAIYSYLGTGDVKSSSFINNRAVNYGGAIIMMANTFNVSSSYFIGNNASYGSAIFKSNQATAHLNNNEFVYNQAASSTITITNAGKNFKAVFTGYDNILNAIWNSDALTSVFVDGVNPVNGANPDKIYQDAREFNQTIIVSIYDENGNLISSETKMTGLYGEVNFTALEGDKIVFTHPEDNFYKYVSNSAFIPDYALEKIVLTPYVIEGDQVRFQIIVHNTGKVDLNDVVVKELDFDGLIYDSYHHSDLWDYSVVDGKPVWKLISPLVPGEVASIAVTFNTTTHGIYNNTVKATADTIDKQATATVNVTEDILEVTKIALIPVTEVGTQTYFEILLHNTGHVDLHDVFVIEDEYEGLIFDHARNDDLWDYSIENGKHKWTLNEELAEGEYVGIFVVFNTTHTGNFTNYIIAGHGKYNKTANATVWVNETVAPPEVIDARMDISITTIHPLISLGNQTIFEILVHNTGNVRLTNVSVAELSHDGLIFDHFIDHTRFWDYTQNTVSTTNGLLGAPLTQEHVWTMNFPLFVGEYLGFFVVFNSTATGTFTNTVLGNSDQTPDGVEATDIVDVIVQEYTIEKVAINSTVQPGDQVKFEIIVHNTGGIDLTDVVITELPDDGLIYDSFIDNTDNWQKEGSSWKLISSVAPGEYTGFFVIFNTTSEGTFTNKVTSGSKSASASVRVVTKSIKLDTEVIKNHVYVGDETTVKITVTNDGLVDLDDVYVRLNINDYLNYLTYYAGEGNWTNDGLMFYLNHTLKVGESASFYIMLKTTKAGNFTNLATAGFDGEDKVNSTFEIEVLNLTNKTFTDVSTGFNWTDGEVVYDEATSSIASAPVKSTDKNATGNPIGLFVVLLINIVLLRRRNN